MKCSLHHGEFSAMAFSTRAIAFHMEGWLRGSSIYLVAGKEQEMGSGGCQRCSKAKKNARQHGQWKNNNKTPIARSREGLSSLSSLLKIIKRLVVKRYCRGASKHLFMECFPPWWVVTTRAVHWPPLAVWMVRHVVRYGGMYAHVVHAKWRGRRACKYLIKSQISLLIFCIR